VGEGPATVVAPVLRFAPYGYRFGVDARSLDDDGLQTTARQGGLAERESTASRQSGDYAGLIHSMTCP
jgi:hypothetical protein